MSLKLLAGKLSKVVKTSDAQAIGVAAEGMESNMVTMSLEMTGMSQYTQFLLESYMKSIRDIVADCVEVLLKPL